MQACSVPACPPTTGQLTSCGSSPFSSEMNLLALTMSRVVTPKILSGLSLPAFLNTSLAMGTVELTGLEMMARQASGHTSAAA